VSENLELSLFDGQFLLRFDARLFPSEKAFLSIKGRIDQDAPWGFQLDLENAEKLKDHLEKFISGVKAVSVNK